ncbi:polyprenyl synthetase family protein [Lipingzhangella sp. LS1_29]|uniref:Polyprenyl synthetase family protein n=1 Tax=Lipingzhangella rawalii TaxID=2055835 RepID=A0ABU2H3S7_9ACTN|nr:polyprenyl synthetase family protein [Lipingzhangella rawalii]MDS1269480.1 polyprenyl synthetase family protein [Lipingzhangella rawalii]
MASVDPASIAAVRPFVDAELKTFLDQRRTHLLEIGPELEPLLDSLERMISGGKRIRPAFCYWGWRGAGGPEVPEIHTAAAALELLQACALLHDDVIDNSDTRRGLPATHRQLADLHHSSGWGGSATAFGNGAAILLGDLCLAWSDELYTNSGLCRDAIASGRPAFDAMRAEVMAGQYLDMLEQARQTEHVDAALRVMHYKAAKYTVERPLHLGAQLAGASDDLVAAYTAYGRPLGLAFQLRDDILGAFGNPEQTGKPAGDDFREGKRTVLVAETLRLANPDQGTELRNLLGDPDLSEETVSWLRDVIVSSGALRACEDRIANYAAEAQAALDGIRMPEEARRGLEELVAAATVRDT